MSWNDITTRFTIGSKVSTRNSSTLGASVSPGQILSTMPPRGAAGTGARAAGRSSLNTVIGSNRRVRSRQVRQAAGLVATLLDDLVISLAAALSAAAGVNSPV